MKILIIEDELQTAGLLKEIIVQVRPNAEILGIIESIKKTVEYLTTATNTPDLIFMDIQLADGLSFEIFSRVQVKCPVIFCTAYDQYSLQAFKTSGIEYILKPIKEDDIRAAFTKFENLKQYIRPETEMLEAIKGALGYIKKFKTSILVHYRGSHIPVPVANIALFQLEDESLFAHTFDNKKYPVFKAMDELESGIDPSQFYRINRQVLLNRRAITEIQPYFNRKVIIKTHLNINEQLIVSRLKVTGFMDWLEQP